MKNMLAVKDCGGKEVIIEVGLAVIGIALLLIFKNQISNLVNTLVNLASENINKMFGTVTYA